MELRRVFAEFAEGVLTGMTYGFFGKVYIENLATRILIAVVPLLLPLRRLVYQVARLQVASLSLGLTLTMPINFCYL